MIVEGNVDANVIKCVENILATPVGTVPFDRNFGIDISFLDQPTELSKGQFRIEVVKKLRKYEPRVVVERIEFESRLEKIEPKVVIRWNQENYPK